MPSPFGGTAHDDAPQHGPRPLPLFLDMLRSETAASQERRAAALAGLRRYQQAPRVRRRMGPVRHRAGAARLRDYGGDGPPVVLVPSLINPAFVLDLAPGRSLAAHIAASGFRTWLVDWGTPRPQDAALDLGGHVARRLVPLLRKLDRPPLMVGYCLGGTLALAAAALAGADVAGVATIAAPWRFAGYGDGARADMLRLWDGARAGAERMGALPMEVLQSGFWRLDPGRTVGKYAALATMDERAVAEFVALEDWANAGAPLTYGAARELFDDLVGTDRTGAGAWRVAGQRTDPAALACPAVEFVSLTDRITPAATAAGLPERRELSAGHVGIVVGGRRHEMLWDPLVAWLRQSQTGGSL